MFFDWIGREGGAILSWWLLTLLAGAAAYPLFYRLMGALPSRGYALARAAGLILIGFVFWILNNLGLLTNTPGSTVFAAVIVLVIGLASYASWQDREPILPWLRANWSHILSVEVLFAVLFLGWALVRALNPNLTGTEKPMEMAFLSAVRRSATFPPHDPWMSGYAISYYHFGYILMGTLANLSGVTNGVAFNLALPLLFALTGVGAFGVGYDLVVAKLRYDADSDEADHVNTTIAPEHSRKPQHYPQAIGVGVLAAVFVVLMGNLGTAAVEVPYQTCIASPSYLHALDLEERDAYPAQGSNGSCVTSGSADPGTWNYWWWFRYSRVVRDLDINGGPIGVQPITEFPQFSFVLSDMHPHVLALPFAMLCIGLALNLVLRRRALFAWEVVLYGLIAGGMIFLNSWDAIYLVLIVGAEAVRRLIANGTGKLTRSDWYGLIRLGVALVALTAILYLPFFASFRSQAGGIAPNILWPTRFPQFFIMFGIFLVIIGGYLIAEVRRAGDTFNWRFAISTLVTIIVGFVGVVILAAVFMFILSRFNENMRASLTQLYNDWIGDAGIGAVLLRRLDGAVTEGVLLLFVLAVIGRFFAGRRLTADDLDGEQDADRKLKHLENPGLAPRIITYSPATAFVLLIIAAGAILTLVPDFAYLKDNFGVRINTVFKLYFQTWLLWGVASAFALWSVLADSFPVRLSVPARAIYGGVCAVLIAAGIVYPAAAIYSRAIKEGGHTNPDNTTALTLEATDTLAIGQDDYKAIQCLAKVANLDTDVVVEAASPASAYHNEWGRVSGLSGIPTVLGWPNHEQQWRGNTYGQAANGRMEDISKLYDSTNWADVIDVIQHYKITYIYVGPTERQHYSAEGIAKFAPLPTVCHEGDVAVYSADAVGLQSQPPAGR